MTVDAPSTKHAIVEFIRQEAPLEFARLQSIGRLASALPDCSGDRPDLSQDSYGSWVREAFGFLAS